MPEAKRILVLAPTANAAARFRDAADKLALELLLACSDLTGAIQLNFETRDSALQVVEFAQQYPLAAIVPIADETAPVAARAASMLGLPFHTPKAADACRDKSRLRARVEASGLGFAGSEQLAGLQLKTGPLTLVCTMSSGQLRVLAVNDPVAPVPRTFPQLDPAAQASTVEALKTLVHALGLKHGPLFVRLWPDRSPTVLADVSVCYLPEELARSVTFRIPLVDGDISLEEVLIRNALALDTARIYLDIAQ